MGLNIKNERTHELVRELARETGQTQTAAVEDAVRRRLGEIREESADELVERLTAIALDCAARLDDATRAIDHGALLYDEMGLPR